MERLFGLAQEHRWPLVLFVDGGVKVVQSATVVVSLPLLAIGVLLAVSVLRMIREDEASGRI